MNVSSNTSLSNFNMYFIETKKFKTNSITVYFRLELLRETVTKIALLPRILEVACNKYRTMKSISRHLENMYGASIDFGLTKNSEVASLYFSCEFVRNDILDTDVEKMVIEFLIEAIFNPLIENTGFSHEIMKQEKDNLAERVKSVKNDKRLYSKIKCIEHTFKDQPFGLSEYGYIEDLSSIDQQNLYKFYQEVIKNAPVDIFCTGFFNRTALEENLTKSFSPFLSKRESKAAEFEFAKLSTDEESWVKEMDNVNQSKLCLSLIYNVEQNNIVSAFLANSIFGDGASSKLFVNVRERLNLAYYCSSKFYMSKGISLVSSGIQKLNIENCYNEIKSQLNKMKSGEITDKELTYTKNRLNNQMNSLKDDKVSLERFYYNRFLSAKNETIESLVSEIMKLNIKDVVLAAKKVKIKTIFLLEEC